MNDWNLKPAEDTGLRHHERVRSIKRERSIYSSITSLVWWSVIALIMRGIFHFKVTGRDLLPPDLPFVIIGNHASHFDVICLMLALPTSIRDRMYPLAAADHFFGEIPLATFTALVLNALPVDRQGGGKGREAMAQLRARIQTSSPGIGYVLFPEGTRSRTGKMGRFRSGVGLLVAGTNIPVVPCHISGAQAAWPADRRLPRLFSPISIVIGKPQVFAEIATDQLGCEAIARSLEDAVTDLLIAQG